MATLSIVEFSGGTSAGMNAARGRSVRKQTIVITGASTPSTFPFHGDTRLIRVTGDVDCCIDIGASPAAASPNWPLWAKQVEYFDVTSGDYLAVVAY